jgi:hypothetical protein
MIWKLFVLLCFCGLWFGVAGPYMVSSQSDALALGWVLVTGAATVYGIDKAIKKGRES